MGDTREERQARAKAFLENAFGITKRQRLVDDAYWTAFCSLWQCIAIYKAADEPETKHDVAVLVSSLSARVVALEIALNTMAEVNK